MSSYNFHPRAVDLARLTKTKSAFLFGPRQTGKSTLIRNILPNARVYNLLDSEVYADLSTRPQRLREETIDPRQLVVIDEIQKLPQLLDIVHLLIEEKGTRFLLTGSSARTLRRGGVNLLGGRARSLYLHPFVHEELGDEFDLRKALDIGLLPSIYFSDEPQADLRAYVGDYLTQEIAAEGLARRIPMFARFLEVAALCNGQLINYSQVASDAQVPKSTVQGYFEVLKDTLLATEVPPWMRTRRRKALATAKIYLFDIGVARSLQHRAGLKPRSPEFGDAFEAYVFHELRTYIDYRTPSTTLCYWRSQSGFEVDFILGDRIAIEVKAKDNVGDRDLKGLRALREEDLLAKYVLVSLESRRRIVDDIHILPWKEFLAQLWKGDLT